jgi:hypothetical protein
MVVTVAYEGKKHKTSMFCSGSERGVDTDISGPYPAVITIGRC